jgi:hypothetical protein
MNVQLYFIALLCISFTVSGYAADGRMIRARSVDLQTYADPQLGSITIHATASETGQIESISLSCQSQKIDVPAVGLRDLKNADIGSLRVTAVLFDPKKPSLLLSLSSWDPALSKPADLPLLTSVSRTEKLFIARSCGAPIQVPITMTRNSSETLRREV